MCYSNDVQITQKPSCSKHFDGVVELLFQPQVNTEHFIEQITRGP